MILNERIQVLKFMAYLPFLFIATKALNLISKALKR